MFNDRFFQKYRIVLFIVLIVILIPTLALCAYTRPTADDVWQPEPVMRTWVETGSLFQTAVSAIKTTINIYFEYSGIFFGMLLMLIPFSIFGYKLVWINSVLAIILLLCAMWRLACCARYLCKDVANEVIHCLALLLSILVFC